MATSPLGEFLKARRALTQPEDVGIVAGGQRRVPGLRREELAVLADLSVDYYVQLEQGRRVNLSPAALDGLARALRLDAIERDHLIRLAGGPAAARVRDTARSSVSADLTRLLELMADVPAVVLGPRTEFLAWTTTFAAVFDVESRVPAERNAARELFLRPEAPTRYRNWSALADDAIGMLRLEAGMNPGDRVLARLVGELSLRSAEFRIRWARHSIRQKAIGQTILDHPNVGELHLTYQSMQLPGPARCSLVAYTWDRASSTDEGLALLTSLDATTRAARAADAAKSTGA
ncbi:helix-turn-helix transcriptional regulator [Amycolatopsis sp. NPDC051061]|uniref:helix-turn-helix transcriptional regulator n=1 Tax=Amycolatopsis sp. NPDC051061 TaxID=3155042 RepID=UPI00343D0506